MPEEEACASKAKDIVAGRKDPASERIIKAMSAFKDEFKLETAEFLDKKTRAWRTDGGHELKDIRFTMTMPKGNATGPVPVFSTRGL